jgi:hypothetical protein
MCDDPVIKPWLLLLLLLKGVGGPAAEGETKAKASGAEHLMWQTTEGEQSRRNSSTRTYGPTRNLACTAAGGSGRQFPYTMRATTSVDVVKAKVCLFVSRHP